jgi:hypothetical protein
MTAAPLFFPDDDGRAPLLPRRQWPRPSSSPMTTAAPLFFPDDPAREFSSAPAPALLRFVLLCTPLFCFGSDFVQNMKDIDVEVLCLVKTIPTFACFLSVLLTCHRVYESKHNGISTFCVTQLMSSILQKVSTK